MNGDAILEPSLMLTTLPPWNRHTYKKTELKTDIKHVHYLDLEFNQHKAAYIFLNLVMTTVTVTWRLYTFPKTKAIDDEDNLKVHIKSSFPIKNLSYYYQIFCLITSPVAGKRDQRWRQNSRHGAGDYSKRSHCHLAFRSLTLHT